MALGSTRGTELDKIFSDIKGNDERHLVAVSYSEQEVKDEVGGCDRLWQALNTNTSPQLLMVLSRFDSPECKIRDWISASSSEQRWIMVNPSSELPKPYFHAFRIVYSA